MKRAFVLTSNCGMTSALVPLDTQDILSIGDRITATRALDLGITTIMEGECGTVDHIDGTSGLVEILMDLYHKGLAAWDNHMWLEPYGTEDNIDGVRLISCVLSLRKVA